LLIILKFTEFASKSNEKKRNPINIVHYP